MAVYTARTSHNTNYTLRLTVEETNVNTTNNTSDVDWALDFITTSSGYNGTIYGISCSINGQAVYSETNKVHNYSTHNKTYPISSGTVTGIVHNNDGTKTINVSALFDSPTGASYSPGDASINENFALTNIPRTSVLNSATVSIATNGNSATITPNITKHSSSYYDTLFLVSGNDYISWAGVTSGSSKSFNTTQLNKLYDWFKTSTSITLDAYVETKTSSTGTIIGTSTKIATIVNLPNYSLTSTITATDNVTTYNTYKNNTNDLIANLSQPNLVFSATSSTGSTYGRPITHTINNEASTSPKTINNYMGGNFTLVSTDGRKTSTATTTNTTIPYQKPIINCQIIRTSPTSDTANVTISGKYYDGNGLKTSALLTRSIVLKYTETGGTEQTISNFTINETTSNHIVSYTATATLSNLDYKKGISYVAAISDLIGVITNNTGSIPAGQPVWNAYRDSNGDNHMVINGIFETEYGKTIIPKPYIRVSKGNDTQDISQSQSWTKITLDGGVTQNYGNFFTFDLNNNVIVIPRGVKKIRVTGAFGSRYSTWVGIGTGSSANDLTVIRAASSLVQPTGNGYCSAALPTIEIDIDAQNSEKYVGLLGYAYTSTDISIGSGLPYVTQLYVELLELY